MSVYFIQGVEGGPIKIGQTSVDIRIRLATLQAGSPVRLRVLGTTSTFKESQLHKRFDHLRLHGEWFAPKPELISFINESIDPDSGCEYEQMHKFKYKYYQPTPGTCYSKDKRSRWLESEKQYLREHYAETPFKTMMEFLHRPENQVRDQAKRLGLRRKRSSPFRGVSRHSSGRWVASIMIQRQFYHLGIFSTEEEAAEARSRFEKDHSLLQNPDS